MFAQFYAGMSWSALPVMALVLFLATFVAVLLRTMIFAHREHIDEMARLPLEDEPAAPSTAPADERTAS